MKLGDEHRAAMGLGLSGSHRVGKTTVAELMAKSNNCPFVMSSATAVARDMGFKFDGSATMQERMAYQNEVLRRFAIVYDEEAKGGLFVSDRTPLDFAAYAMADWSLATSSPEVDTWLLDYVKRCKDLTGRYFFQVGIIQPGIVFVEAEGKPPQNPLYQEYLNTLLIGLGADHDVLSNFFLMPRDVLRSEERGEILAAEYGENLKEYQEFLAGVLPAGQ